MNYIAMLDRMRLPRGEVSLAKLEKSMRFAPDVKTSVRLNTFIAKGIICPQCNHNVCEVTASAYSRDILFMICCRCNNTW